MSVANPDRLSFERTRAAYDRTVMTWIRTAASLITFGFSAYKFFQFAPGGGRRHPLLGPREFSLPAYDSAHSPSAGANPSHSRTRAPRRTCKKRPTALSV